MAPPFISITVFEGSRIRLSSVYCDNSSPRPKGNGTYPAPHDIRISRQKSLRHFQRGTNNGWNPPAWRVCHVAQRESRSDLRGRRSCGSAVAAAFAKEGARVFLSGRTVAKVEAVARGIASNGGVAEAAEVDALDEALIEKHLDGVVSKTGGIDISFNAIGVPASVVADKGMQGVPLTEIPTDSFMHPITTYTRSHFLTARAAACRMTLTKKPGVVLMHTPEPARVGVPLLGGMAPAWAALEAICRSFSAELAAYGIRAVCLRSTAFHGKHESYSPLYHAQRADECRGVPCFRSRRGNDRNRRQSDCRKGQRLARGRWAN